MMQLVSALTPSPDAAPPGSSTPPAGGLVLVAGSAGTPASGAPTGTPTKAATVALARRSGGPPTLPPEPNGDGRARALHTLHGLRPRLFVTSKGIHAKVRRDADRLPVDAALAVLGGDAAVLAEAQRFCAWNAGAVPPDATGRSVWDFFGLWVKAEPSELDALAFDPNADPDDAPAPIPVPPTAWRGGERLYLTAFRVAWLYCVAMQNRGAFHPAAYLHALGCVLPKNALTLADVAGVASVGDVARVCQTGWGDTYAPAFALHLRAAWWTYGGADVAALLSSAGETPDGRALTG